MRVKFGAKVVLHPSFGVSLAEIKSRCGFIRITNNSTLVLNGQCTLNDIEVDGVLKLSGNGIK
jgi:hypothetical protein